jgi:hypothetical protein
MYKNGKGQGDALPAPGLVFDVTHGLDSLT